MLLLLLFFGGFLLFDLKKRGKKEKKKRVRSALFRATTNTRGFKVTDFNTNKSNHGTFPHYAFADYVNLSANKGNTGYLPASTDVVKQGGMILPASSQPIHYQSVRFKLF